MLYLLSYIKYYYINYLIYTVILILLLLNLSNLRPTITSLYCFFRWKENRTEQRKRIQTLEKCCST